MSIARYPAPGLPNSWESLRIVARDAGCLLHLRDRATESRGNRLCALTIKGDSALTVFKIIYATTRRLGFDLRLVPAPAVTVTEEAAEAAPANEQASMEQERAVLALPDELESLADDSEPEADFGGSDDEPAGAAAAAESVAPQAAAEESVAPQAAAAAAAGPTAPSSPSPTPPRVGGRAPPESAAAAAVLPSAAEEAARATVVAKLPRSISAAAREAAGALDPKVKLDVEHVLREGLTTDLPFGDQVRVAFCTCCMRRNWQLRNALPVNLLMAQGWLGRAAFYIVLLDDDVNSPEITGTLEWMRENCGQALAGRRLNVAVGKLDYWHASVGKNAAHVYAIRCLSESWPFDAPDKFLAGGSAPLEQNSSTVVMVNLDADNIMGVRFVQNVVSTFAGHLEDHSYGLYRGRTDGTAGRMAYTVGTFMQLNGYDEELLPSGYQDFDLRDRCVKLGGGEGDDKQRLPRQRALHRERHGQEGGEDRGEGEVL